MDHLKHERRVELASEFANRHFDLMRWGYADEVYALPLHGREHEDKTDPDSPYTVKVVLQFDPNVHHVWRITNQVIDVSEIEQNKGW